MPILTVPKSLYPVVPQLPGVPALLRSGATILDGLTLGYLGFGDALSDLIGADPVKWGIFDQDGQPVADYDSVFTMDYNNDSTISEYKVEEGGFTSFNKVDNSYDSVVVLNCGGSESRRAACLIALQQARASLDLYAIFTPTDTILDANIIGLSYASRATEGSNMLTAHLLLKEVRKNATATFSQPSTASAFLPRAQGQIQTVDGPIGTFSSFA